MTSPTSGNASGPGTTPIGRARLTTPGEITMVKGIVKDAVDPTRVLIHHNDWFPSDSQDENTAVTPDGEMYWPKNIFKEDFLAASDTDGKRWFMHKMTHVWQHQMGMNAIVNGIFSEYVTKYALVDYRLLSDYRMESQADTIADYYNLSVNGLNAWKSWKRMDISQASKIAKKGIPAMLAIYQKILSLFLAGPKNKDCLFTHYGPRSGRDR
ncbi:hypothetical protein [Salmonella enterica]|uniref:hypothetical protein n=1 Tax=Salmonella enterica TaxID=28901 RepID=UPI000F6C63FE|nr:hypothetical protein [Salmonella enterica]EBV1906482.1 hypothetical protein [Salmonella enterica subsp. enterica serovar Kande]VEA52515.1 Uncharacterised protein [Salmonella enterica subsp. enterica]